MIYVFEDYALDTDLYRLHRAGQAIPLQPKMFALLCYLLEHRQRVVLKQELCDQLWPNQAISDAALTTVMHALRQALGDTGQEQKYIQTSHGRGYRFVALVRESHAAPPIVAEPEPVAPVITPERPESLALYAAPPAPEPLAPPQYAPASPLHLDPTPVGERKAITILSGLLIDTPAASAGLDLDTLYTMTQTLHFLVQQGVQHYGGTLQPLIGSRFLALFGAPLAQEDHAQRAALAALDLRQRLRDYRVTLAPPQRQHITVRFGLYTGLVMVGRSAIEPMTAPAIVGDAVTLALGLQERATPDTILCSQATIQALHGLMRFAVLTPEPGAGRTLSLPAYQLLGRARQRAAVVQRSIQPLSPFVGRRRELALLQDSLAQVESRRGHVISLVGEPGVGKSRLCYEFRHSLPRRRLTYLAARCLSYGHNTPYLPLIDILQRACGITSADAPATRTAKVHHQLRSLGLEAETHAYPLLALMGLSTPSTPGPALSPEALKTRILTTLLQMCLNGSRQRPLILEIDDLQWIDATSEACLTALVERLTGAAILVLATYRPGYRPPWLDKSYATQIALGRLSRRDSHTVVRARLPQATMPEALVQQILAKADGNAFFLEELSRALAEVQHDRSSPPGPDNPLEVPDTIQAVLIARSDRLSDQAKYLLQLASVIGKDVPRSHLQVLTDWPTDTLQQGIDALQATEFLYTTEVGPDPIYTFQHALTQEVIYQSLLQPRRQQSHQQLAQALVKQFALLAAQHPERVAHHYTAAELHTEALPFWYQAGEQALARSAYTEAISHLTQGLAGLATLSDTLQRRHDELRFDIALGRAFMATRGYGSSDAGRVYAQARALCDEMAETPQRFAVLRGLATFYYMRADHATAQTLGQQCLDLAQRLGEPALRLRAYLTLGQQALFQGDYRTAHSHLCHGYDLVQPGETHVIRAVQDPAVTCYALQGPTLWLLGYPDQARQRRDQALALARTRQHPFSLAEALIFAAVVSICLQEYVSVRTYAEEALALATAQGFPHWEAHAAVYQGWAMVRQGRGEAGLLQMRHGQTVWQTIQSELARPWLLTLLADAHGCLGEFGAGLRLLEEALEVLHKNDERHYESEMYRLKGEFLWQQGVQNRDSASEARRKTVEACWRQARDIARRQQASALELRAVMSLARLWQQQGNTAGAVQLLAPCYDSFREGHDTADLQAARNLLADLMS